MAAPLCAETNRCPSTSRTELGSEEDEGVRMKIRRTEDVAWRRIDHETVVVHLTRHRMYALNESGGQIWEALAAPLDGDKLTQLLRDAHVSAFLADLSAEGLVESDPPLPAFQAPPPSENDRVPPRIEWREEVRRFAGECAFIPAGSEACFQNPSTS